MVESAYHETVTALATALETKDTGTRAHSQRVQRYALELTKAIDPALMDDPSTEYGFLLHDVGKIGIPDGILLKPGPLSEAERRRMETHTVLGEQMLGGVAFFRGEGLRVVRYAVKSDADITARDPDFSLAGMRFRLRTTEGEREFHSPLVGPPHICNTLAAIASGLALGYSLDVITKALEKCSGAPGRFERVSHDGDFAVVVDYAHSDDALLNVLRTARQVTKGRIITVFGCGGDRDRSKRAPMGEAAGSLSDVVILTSDNPRTEGPDQILADAEVGIQKTGKPYEKIADRREAIHHAISQARIGDLVLIAGKGHEDYQIIGREVFHFDDKEVAREALASRA